MINTISINFRPDDKSCIPLLSELVEFLEKEKRKILLPQYEIIKDEPFYRYSVDEKVFVHDTDLAIIIGGDGTFLRTARLFFDTEIPIFGINRGNLGFLTEFSPEEYLKYLKEILKGNRTIFNRLVMTASHLRNGKEINNHRFINDAVISKGVLTRPIRVELEVDGNFLNSYLGDGLIISTPTGSTAYALSAGGPIVVPSSANVFLISPICPHSLSMRPMIFHSSAVLKARIVTEHKNLLLTIDGQVSIPIEGGDVIKIAQSVKKIKLITHPEKNYYDILREKLGWG